MDSAQNPARHSPLIEALFPAGVFAAELRAPGSVSQLLPAEAATITRMVPSRAAEFAAGRLCARAVLTRLGREGAAVPAAADRKPVWPDGIIGSITHTDGFCAAVAAPCGPLQGLGIDTEVMGRVTAPLAARICLPEELAWIASLADVLQPAARALVFAAKEAFYKAQSPLTDEWLGFDALRVETDALAEVVERGGVGAFRANPTRAITLDRWVAGTVTGRFRCHEGFVSAGLALI